MRLLPPDLLVLELVARLLLHRVHAAEGRADDHAEALLVHSIQVQPGVLDLDSAGGEQ